MSTLCIIMVNKSNTAKMPVGLMVQLVGEAGVSIGVGNIVSGVINAGNSVVHSTAVGAIVVLIYVTVDVGASV